MGISEEELPRVVEPFVRGNGTTQRIRGSGLGLALTNGGIHRSSPSPVELRETAMTAIMQRVH